MSPAVPAAWSTLQDVRAALQRRWDTGELLTWVASREPWTPVRVPLRGPSARELSEQFGAVQDWSTDLEHAAEVRAQGRRGGERVPAFRVERRAVGGRLVGSNAVPVAAWLDSPDQVWSLLGTRSDVEAYTALLDLTREHDAVLGQWAALKPLTVLAHRSDWTQVIETVLWLHPRRGTAAYLREIDVPGVDTKFIEARRGLLGDLLDVLSPDGNDQSRSAARHFARRYGFSDKPRMIRMRSLDGWPLFGAVSDAVVRVQELARTEIECEELLVVENEVTFLALPVIPNVLAVFGAGFDVLRLGRVHWIADRAVTYWGDIDTHGFVILDRLRGMLPHVDSVLMDMATLMSHQTQWVREPTPSREILSRLTPVEAEVYAALATDALGPAVRLEQERVNFTVAEAALRARLG
ncbi:MAG: DUF2220 family protein [Actinomycetota bacterium]|nr:DUF2220 family protein [Actinomycetota bacterium]